MLTKVSNKRKKSNFFFKNSVDLRKVAQPQLSNYKSNLNPELPFKTMNISDATVLNKMDNRSVCIRCNKSRKYFCYTCHLIVPELKDLVPVIQLPCAIDIIKHPKEIEGKSTAVHAAIIAPEAVRILTYPDIPDYKEEENIFLIFPGRTSSAVEEINKSYIKERNENGRSSQNLRAVFIDSTWNQSKKIANDERLRDLPCIELKSRETMFWRYQKGKPKTYLATIEAIYYFLVDLHKIVLKKEYNGEYDDLLFFFKFMYDKIHALYNPNDLLAYKEL